jgi:PAS domain S-box-containing protein
MTTAKKLWAGFGILLALLPISTFIIAACLSVLRTNLRQLSAVEEPLATSAYEMELNITASGTAVLNYLGTGDPSCRDQVERHKVLFQQFKTRFDQLAKTPHARHLAQKVEALHQRYSALGEELMNNRDREQELFEQLGQALEDVHKTIDRRVTAGAKGSAPSTSGRVGVIANMEADIAEVGSWLGNYRQTSKPEYRERIRASARNFKQHLADFQKISWTEEERSWGRNLEREFARLMSLVEEALDQEDRRRQNLGQFLDLLTTIDRAFDEGIRASAQQNLTTATRSTQRFVNGVSIATVVLLAAGLLIGITTAIIIGRAILRAEGLLRVTLSSIGDAIIITDTGGLVTSLNPVAEQLTGWTQAEAAGKPLTTVFNVLDENSQPIQDPIMQMTGKGAGSALATYSLRARDQGERPIETGAAPIRDHQGRLLGTVLLFRDIAERRSAEAARDRTDREKAFVAEVSLALALTGSLRDVLQPCAEAMVRYTDAAKVRIWTFDSGENTVQLEASAGKRPPHDEPHRRVHLEAVTQRLAAHAGLSELAGEVLNDPYIRDQAWARREGTAFSGYPLILGNQLIGVLAVFTRTPLTDETFGLLRSGAQLIAQGIARKLAEQEREHLLAAERAARSDAERANRSKDEFLATISHELRTPLQAIVGWAAVMRSGSGDPESIQAAEVIERNAQAQARLIDDLLDMSRIIAGKIHLDLQRVELAPVIAAVLDAIRPAAEAHGLEIRPMLDPDVGSVQGDPVRLQQIVGNILSNAVKFTPRGGTVTVVLRRIDAQAEITITDTGQGIAPEFLPDVFKQFQQADASTSRKHGGLGLGMAIVKHLVELHAGMVQAESPGQGKGATFRVLLPLATEGLEETEIPRSPKPATSKTDGGDLTSLRGIRILLVDDSPDARQLIKRVLEDHEAQVVAAESAGEALAEIERSHPNVLISDIGLPGKDGYELIREVRKLPPERGGMMPAVALTALVQPPDRLRALAAGYQVHIAKPIEPSQLVAIVAKLARHPSA